jgi:hypothetical protein
MTEEAVRAYTPNVSGIYLVLVPHGGRWFVRYVGKTTSLRARLRQHLARYEGAWVCWRYEHDDDALYVAECCAYWLYGGAGVLDNCRDPERPYASRRPPCGELACPVPRRAFASRAY